MSNKYAINRDFFICTKYKPAIFKPVLPLANFAITLMPKKIKSDVIFTIRKKKIKSYDGVVINLIFIEPKWNYDVLPCLIYCHGGGFLLKAPKCHYDFSKVYASDTPCRVVFVDYRLVPKYCFPTPLEDCYAGFKYVYDNAEELRIDKKRIAVGGDSAGGNLATGLCLMAKDRLNFSFCYQMLVYPVIDRRQKTSSMEEFDDTPMWNSKLNKKMWELYLPTIPSEHIEYASPLEGDLKDMPNAYVETAEYDCLHDEAIEYAKTLIALGKEVEINETKETLHGYDVIRNSVITKNSLKRRCEALRRAFYKK